jgi:hypothetical protein
MTEPSQRTRVDLAERRIVFHYQDSVLVQIHAWLNIHARLNSSASVGISRKCRWLCAAVLHEACRMDAPYRP